MTMLWIEATDGDGKDYAARWDVVTDEQQDSILAFAVTLLGEPDTTA